MSTPDTKVPIIRAKNIIKAFPGVKALSDVSFDLYPGEVHCLVGENGAGKSTLIKILSGALRPDSGEIFFDGRRLPPLNPHISQKLGIQVIYQENILVPQMSVAENIFVGRENAIRFGFVDHVRTIFETDKLIKALGIELDPEEKVENLSVADQQFVKILKAVAYEPKVLIMDEPTTMFNTKDIDSVLRLVKDISSRGIGVIYISHHLKEVVQIADRITVLRDGKTVECHDNSGKDIDLNLITKEMVGRPVDLFYQKEQSEIGVPVLEVENLKVSPSSPPINFVLRRGEILGIAGMVGSGRTEILMALFGATRRAHGTIIINGKEISIKTPHDAIRAGMGFITEDRQKIGLALSLSIIKNITVASLDLWKGVFLNLSREAQSVQEVVERLDIRTPSLHQEVQFLSGGNQQKVVLARWLFRNVDILVFDEPTRGVDVNAKAEIYNLMSTLAKNGKAILMVSSDMPELIAMSDRVLVIRKGNIVQELSREEISEETIISSAIGVTASGSDTAESNK